MAGTCKEKIINFSRNCPKCLHTHKNCTFLQYLESMVGTYSRKSTLTFDSCEPLRLNVEMFMPIIMMAPFLHPSGDLYSSLQPRVLPLFHLLLIFHHPLDSSIHNVCAENIYHTFLFLLSTTSRALTTNNTILKYTGRI